MVIRCKRGHFYDDRHGACPVCGSGREEEPSGKEPDSFKETVLPKDHQAYAPDPICWDGLGPSYEKPSLPSPWSDFQVLGRLGSGSVGKVFQIQRVTDYAMKVIPIQSKHSRELARREYEFAKRLQDCEHTIHCYDFLETESACMLMEDLGVLWMDQVRGQSSSVGNALNAVLQVLDALSFMQKEGLLHMDVNPKNILACGEKVKLGDFSHSIPCEIGKVYTKRIGTDAFMAPEVVYGKACSGKEDIYSLGLTMFVFLTGGGFPFSFLDREPRVRRPSDKIQTVYLCQELKDIIEKASAFDPQERYESPEAMAQDIRDFISSHPDLIKEKLLGSFGGFPGMTTPWYLYSTDITRSTVSSSVGDTAQLPCILDGLT